MRVLWGLSALALVLVVSGTAPAATSDACGPEVARSDDQPQWSPDGTRVALVRRQDFDCPSGPTATFELETVAATGSEPTQLTTLSYPSTPPAWSPQGDRIAIVDDDIARIVDTHGRDVVAVPVPFCCTSPPSWSPDETHIAVGTLVVDAATGDARTLDGPVYGKAAWSPDSRRIAYLALDGLEVASIDGSERNWIGPGGGSGGSVHWSPDGAWIAYEIEHEFRFVHPDGSGYRFMPDEGVLLGWRPDSRAVLDYVPDDQRLLAIDRDDGHATPVGSSPREPASFSWTRMAALYVAMDLCPRPGIFLKPALGLEQRLTNDCVIRGTPGADRLVGTSLPDALVGGAGNDALLGLGGDDILVGGRGNDRISGGEGDDIAYGDAGDDTISSETVFGGRGHDVLTVGTDPRWPAKVVQARDHERDVIRCPLGQWPGPTLAVDKIDRTSSRCYGT